MLYSTTLSDVVISLNEIEIPTDKFILFVSSPVFKALLENDMIESTTNKVVIGDFCEDTVRAMLRCIYDPTAVDVLMKEYDLLFLAIAHK
jgi:hypothetical protein